MVGSAEPQGGEGGMRSSRRWTSRVEGYPAGCQLVGGGNEEEEERLRTFGVDVRWPVSYYVGSNALPSAVQRRVVDCACSDRGRVEV